MGGTELAGSLSRELFGAPSKVWSCTDLSRLHWLLTWWAEVAAW